MEMSIDQAISHLDTYSSTMGSGQTTQAQHEESKRVAIETMRKYQKIEELVEYHMLRFLPKERMSSFQKDILEVVEDWND